MRTPWSTPKHCSTVCCRLLRTYYGKFGRSNCIMLLLIVQITRKSDLRKRILAWWNGPHARRTSTLLRIYVFCSPERIMPMDSSLKTSRACGMLCVRRGRWLTKNTFKSLPISSDTLSGCDRTPRGLAVYENLIAHYACNHMRELHMALLTPYEVQIPAVVLTRRGRLIAKICF